MVGHRARRFYHLTVSDSFLAEALRARGLRLTAQREFVLKAVRDLGHATPEQVHGAVRKVAAGVNITTVYRTLELLEDLGMVTHTHLSHGSPTYHAVTDDQHVHLVCRMCGAVDEVDTDLLGPLAGTLERERGFIVDIGHLALFGVCDRCGRLSQDPGARAPDQHPAPDQHQVHCSQAASEEHG